MTAIFKEVAKIWFSLSHEEKIPYINRSEADRTRFQEESETFIRQRFQHSSNKYDPRMQRPAMANCRRPPTGYMVFAKLIRNNVKNSGQDLTVKELMRLIGREWQKLSIDEKYKYDVQA